MGYYEAEDGMKFYHDESGTSNPEVQIAVLMAIEHHLGRIAKSLEVIEKRGAR